MANDNPLRLTLTLEGELVAENRLPLSELGRISQQLRAVLKDVAIVLAGDRPSGRSGRASKFIEESTDLRVVAGPRAGSFCLELEVPPAAAPPQEELAADMGPRLADRAVQALVKGLETLDDEAETLPNGFDRGVLRALGPFKTSLRKGISEITLAMTGPSDGNGSTRITSERLDKAERLIKKPVRAHAVAEGVLQMVDFASLVCRIDRPAHESVACYFEEKDRDQVQQAVRQFVRVAGEGEFAPESIEPSKIHVVAIEVMYEALGFDTALFWRERSAAELAEDQGAAAVELRKDTETDPWRSDEEAAALIATIRDDA